LARATARDAPPTRSPNLASRRRSRVPSPGNVRGRRRPPLGPFNGIAPHRPPGKTYRQPKDIWRLPVASVHRRVPDESEIPPLDLGVQAVSLWPYRSGVAGRPPPRLRLPPALPTCCCPLGLSPPGKSLTLEPCLELRSTALTINPMRDAAHPSMTSGFPGLPSPGRRVRRGVLHDGPGVSPASRDLSLCSAGGRIGRAFVLQSHRGSRGDSAAPGRRQRRITMVALRAAWPAARGTRRVPATP
jgi:hypothetical protein